MAVLDPDDGGRLTRVLGPASNLDVTAKAVNGAGQIAVTVHLYATTNFGRHRHQGQTFVGYAAAE